MPMEAIGIRPVERPQTPSAEGVTRRGDGGGSSGFTPQTNVSLKTAIQDMAGILSKIGTTQDAGMEKMPQDLQKIVQNIMRQAFSMEQTLGQGIGSTLESQRFSMEQLTAFSRMLTQLGALTDKGFSMEISDNLQALLTNLKNYVIEKEGAQLSPVLLNKTAFELLDTKISMEDLSRALQMLLSEMQTAGVMTAQQPVGDSDALGFLKQLVQYFMPRPSSEGGQAPQGQAQGQQAQANTQGQQATQNGQANQTNQTTNQTGQQTSSNQTGQANQTIQTTQPGQTQQPGQMTQGQQTSQSAQSQAPQSQSGTQTAQNAPQGQASQTQNSTAPQNQTSSQAQPSPQGQQSAPSQGQPTATHQTATPNVGTQSQVNASNTQQPATNQNGNAAQNASQPSTPNQAPPNAPSSAPQSQPTPGQSATQGQTSQTTQQTQQQNGQPPTATEQNTLPNEQDKMLRQPGQPISTQQVRQAKAQMMAQPLQNTEQTMNTMKNVAQFLLKNASLTPEDAHLLQNFVSGQETVLSDKEARQLQTLLRICQQNVPTTVQQAAIQQNMPDLPKLWAFMQLCDMVVAKKMSARQLKKAGKDVADFALSVRNTMGGDNSGTSPAKGRSINFLLPLFMGDNEKSYPAYINVYDEEETDWETGRTRKETWFRVCVLTDNIGAVDITCRVYEGLQLDMRVFFADREAARDFVEVMPEVRRSLRGTDMQLNDFSIGVVGMKERVAG